jgi:tRNA threonylcarbamoyladenosine biosynthesis protein TsaB
MLILSADTSGKNGSIALVRCSEHAPESLELVALEGGTFSAQLIPQIAGLLSKHALNKTDIDAFAVASGPGSFTGLRVGLAAIKALAEILQKPIAALSLLEVIAFDLHSAACDSHTNQAAGVPPLADFARSGKQFLIALDAGRNEAYVGEYDTGSAVPLCISESLLTFDELVARANQLQAAVYTPDETLIAAVSSRAAHSSPINVVRVARPNAVSIARLGYKKILAGQTVSPVELDATYIRRADAEIRNPVRTPA